NRANALGMFPGKDIAEVQLELLAVVALALCVDPIMGEIMPYQGKPYITQKGRHRLDRVAGHILSVSYRPPTEAEEAYWLKHNAIEEGDIIQWAVGKDEVTGQTGEAFGRVLWAEDEKTTGNNRQYSPLVNRKIEMAQKRADMRLRDSMYGPVHKPDAILGIDIGQDGQDPYPDAVEGEARVLRDDESLDSQPTSAAGDPVDTESGEIAAKSKGTRRRVAGDAISPGEATQLMADAGLELENGPKWVMETIKAKWNLEQPKELNTAQLQKMYAMLHGEDSPGPNDDNHKGDDDPDNTVEGQSRMIEEEPAGGQAAH
ncbi:MAG: hypothetical protein V3S68_00545, partial [Dehalococcoidia bacterium]